MNTKIVDEKAAYLAGLFEGEGSASINRRQRRTDYHYSNSLKLDMTDIEPIITIREYLGGSIVLRKEHNNRREQYRWSIHGRNATKAAQKLLPFIKTPRKKGALQCVIDFGTLILNKKREGIDPANQMKRELLYRKSRAYNTRGIGANNRNATNIRLISSLKEEITSQLRIWEEL